MQRQRAARGFTRLDQVNQLVGARSADPDRGFMVRTNLWNPGGLLL